jgi:hypothetical protein
VTGTTAANSVALWKQELQYIGYLEIRKEPIVDVGERITEIRLTRQLTANGEVEDTERTIFAEDGEAVVEEFPD